MTQNLSADFSRRKFFPVKGLIFVAGDVIKEVAACASVRWAGAVVAVRRGQTRAQPLSFCHNESQF